MIAVGSTELISRRKRVRVPPWFNMKRIVIVAVIIGLASCGKKNPKAYQIITTKDAQYYTTFYEVDLDKGCIEFTAYDGEDSSRVRLCDEWDVKPNPDAY